MSEEVKKEEAQRSPSLMLAVGIIALVAVTVSAASLYYKVDVHTPIVMLAVVIGLVARYVLNVGYKKLENAAVESISMAMQSCMILMLVGMLVGVWMRGGVIPGLIYYGLGLRLAVELADGSRVYTDSLLPDRLALSPVPPLGQSLRLAVEPHNVFVFEGEVTP